MLTSNDVVYTGKFSLEGIDTIWVREGPRDIVFLHGDGEELLVKEYGDAETELSRVEKRGTALCFEGSGRHTVIVNVGLWGKMKITEHKIELTVPAGFKGQIYAESKSGDVSLEGTWELQNLQVKTASGDACIGHIRAEHILLESASGDIDVETAWGDRQLISASGDICLKGGRGSLRVETKSGDIDVNGLNAQAELNSISGDIAAGFAAVTGPVKITTVSGDADIKIAADSSVNIDVNTVSGDISTRLTQARISNRETRHVVVHVGNDFTENTPVMEISSVSGDICVEN